MKQCGKCKQTKPLAQFSKKKRNKDGLQDWCKPCSLESTKEWHKENPSFHLLRSYGITLEEKLAMMVNQNNCCAICKEPFGEMKNTHVDHCHTTGKVRAILCNHCNTALGSFDDSPKLLQRAIHYLEHHAKQNTAASIPAGHYPQSEEHTKHWASIATGFGKNDHHFNHNSGTIQRQDPSDSTQESSGDSVAHRNKKVEPSPAFTRSQDNGDTEPERSSFEIRGGRLFD